MKVKRSTRNRSRFVRGLLCIGFAVLALLSFLAPASAATTFTVSKESARHKCSTSDVTFTVDFSRQPDFVTTDAEGRQADSFQYYIVGDPSLPYPQNYD